jgi:cell division protein ZapA (FtsZ GTPase activity inhibitor)
MIMNKDTQELTQITVLIAGKPYPLKVSEADEMVVLKLVNEINEKVTTFQIQYPNKDKQDCLAMTLLSTVVDQFKAKQLPSPDEKMSKRLRSIEDLIDRMVD